MKRVIILIEGDHRTVWGKAPPTICGRRGRVRNIA
jgi:hypothetical protein